MNEPRVYKHSTPLLIAIAVMIALIFAVLSFGDEWNIMTGLTPLSLFVLIIAIVVITMTQKTIISEDEISSQSLFGLKTLRWTEINRISGRGYTIKLHNFDGDVTVTPSPNLPRYEEVVEIIGKKRPDLFNPQEHNELPGGMFLLIPGVIVLILFIGAFLGIGVKIFQSPDSSVVMLAPLFILFLIIAAFAGMAFFQPRSVMLDGSSMTIKYFLREKTLPADEIQSVQFAFQSTRNGKNYFVLLHLANRKTVRISGLKLSVPIVYHILKNWHRNNSITVR